MANAKLNLVQQEGTKRREMFTVTGVSTKVDETSMDLIPALWPQLYKKLPKDARGWPSYGVMWSDGQGKTNYIAGVEVPPGAKVPAGFETKTMAAQNYLIFRLTTDGTALHPQMQAAAQEIWGELVPKTGATVAKSPELEVYAEDFNPEKAGSVVDFWVPVETL